MPAELAPWEETIRRKIQKAYPKARNLQIAYQGLSRKVSIYEYIPKATFPLPMEGQHDFFAKITAYYRPDGTRDPRNRSYMEGLTGPSSLEYEKASMPRFTPMKPLGSNEERKTSLLRELAHEGSTDPRLSGLQQAIDEAAAKPVPLATQLACLVRWILANR